MLEQNYVSPKLNMTVQEFCANFGMGRTKFYQVVNRGDIRPIKCGRKTLIPNTEVQAYQEKLLRDAGIAAE